MSWHCIPEDEEDQHLLSVACPCLPGAALAQRPDGSWGLLVDHCDDQSVMKIRSRSDDG